MTKEQTYTMLIIFLIDFVISLGLKTFGKLICLCVKPEPTETDVQICRL